MRDIYDHRLPGADPTIALIEALNGLPESARRLIYLTHYERYHGEADWTVGPQAGEIHFITHIASDRARDTLKEAINRLPASIIEAASAVLWDSNPSEATVRAEIARLRQIELPREPWMRELDQTTRGDIDQMIRVIHYTFS